MKFRSFGFWHVCTLARDFPRQLRGEESACNTGDAGSIPGPGRPPAEGRAARCGIPAREIPWSEEPGGPQSLGP